MADLLGRPPADDVRKLKEQVETLREQKRALNDRLAEQQRDIDKIREGAKAQKKVRAA